MYNYENLAQMFKVLSDKHRIKILEFLSCSEMCACEIQCHFSFTQPTLSHHMKILVDSQLVLSRRVGKWHYYRLNTETTQTLMASFTELLTDTPDCPCKNRD